MYMFYLAITLLPCTNYYLLEGIAKEQDMYIVLQLPGNSINICYNVYTIDPTMSVNLQY